MKKRYKTFIFTVIVLIMVALCFRSKIFREITYVIFMSFIISYSVKPFHKILTEKGLNKKFSAGIILLVIVSVFLGAFFVIVPSIFKESLNINNAFTKIQDYYSYILERFKPISTNKTVYPFLETLYSKGNKQILSAFNRVLDGLMNMGEDILSFAVIPVIVYYFLAEGDVIYNKLLIYFPTKGRGVFRKIVNDIDKLLSRYIISQFVLCFIIGILTFIILIMLHVNFPIILSILNALFNIIPYFGPLFGAIPAIIIALLNSPRTAIYTAVWLYIIQQIEGDIISPKITGESVSMHPLLIIILLIVGGELAGFLGMVLAVPVGVIIKIIYDDLNYYLF